MKIPILGNPSLRAKAFKLLASVVVISLLVPASIALATAETPPTADATSPTSGSMVAAIPDNTSPTATITSPNDGSTVSGSISVTANASDNIGVTEVDLYIDGVFRGSSDNSTSPYSFPLNTASLSDGPHSLLAVAFDAAENSGISPSIIVNVHNNNSTTDTTTPTVSITSPANHSTVSGSISVDVNASDNVGVTEVNLFVDGTLIGTDTSSPYSFPLDTTTLSNSPHLFMARAYDAAGNIGYSPTSHITINNNSTTADTTPPTVAISSPSDGSTTSGAITVDANASDNVGVSKVELYADGTLMGTDTSSPYSFPLATTALANGSHSLVARAYDAAGNASNSTTVNITVNNSVIDTTAPTVSIASPTDGSTVSGSITVNANASDNVGVTKVELYVDGTLTSTDTSSPYSFPLYTSSLSTGTHSLVARAYDAAGNASNSTAVNITINSTDITAPTVNITLPGEGVMVTGSISVNANASDNVGVTKVELYVDGTLMGTDTSSPYSFSLDTTTLTNGTRSLVARAYDAAGNASNSTAIHITVDNQSQQQQYKDDDKYENSGGGGGEHEDGQNDDNHSNSNSNTNTNDNQQSEQQQQTTTNQNQNQNDTTQTQDSGSHHQNDDNNQGHDD